VDKLIEQDSERPDIKSVVVSLVLNHFWSHVLQSSTKCISLLTVIRLHAPTKVADLDNIPLLDQNILWLDIPMYQPLLVEVINTRTHLDEEIEGGVLREVPLVPDQVEQVASARILESEVDCILVLEA